MANPDTAELINTLLEDPELLDLTSRKFFLDFKAHAKQMQFYLLGRMGAKERLLLGGNRTGKTVGGVKEMAMHLTGYYPAWWPGIKFERPVQAWAATETKDVQRDTIQKLYFGDEITKTKGSVIPSLVSKIYWGQRGVMDTAFIKHRSGGVSQLGFRTYDQGRPKFQGATLDLVHLDEEPDDFGIVTECRMRLLDRQGYLLQTMTPLKGMTELVRYYMGISGDDTEEGKDQVQAARNGARGAGQVRDGVAYMQMGWQDNPHLAPEELARLRKTLKAHEIEAREKGVPHLGGGKVYPVTEESISCVPFPIPEYWVQGLGVDFGWTNPTAGVHLAYDRGNDIIYVIGAYKMAERTPAQHVAAWAQRLWDKLPKFCDPSGQQADKKDGVKLIEAYEAEGVRFEIADNAVESGIMEILQRMQSGRFKVFSTVEPWWSEFRLYRRKEGDGIIVKKDDHLMDATRYGVVSRALFRSFASIAAQQVVGRATGMTA